MTYLRASDLCALLQVSKTTALGIMREAGG